MYNRYIRNDNGSYTRIPEEESRQLTGDPQPAASRQPGGGPPQEEGPPSGSAPPNGPRPGGGEPPPEPPHGGPPPNGPPPGEGPNHGGPGPGYPPPNGPGPGGRSADGLTSFLRHILDQLHMDHVDTGDMILLVLLFFLFREDADEELLVALGLLLIL